jgi:hypothetical protein
MRTSNLTRVTRHYIPEDSTLHNHRSEDLISSQRASVISYGERCSWFTLFTLIMEALSSSETSVFTRATRRKIREDGILEDLISYKVNKLRTFRSNVENAVTALVRHCQFYLLVLVILNRIHLNSFFLPYACKLLFFVSIYIILCIV